MQREEKKKKKRIDDPSRVGSCTGWRGLGGEKKINKKRQKEPGARVSASHLQPRNEEKRSTAMLSILLKNIRAYNFDSSVVPKDAIHEFLGK